MTFSNIATKNLVRIIWNDVIILTDRQLKTESSLLLSFSQSAYTYLDPSLVEWDTSMILLNFHVRFFSISKGFQNGNTELHF